MRTGPAGEDRMAGGHSAGRRGSRVAGGADVSPRGTRQASIAMGLTGWPTQPLQHHVHKSDVSSAKVKHPSTTP